MAGARVTDLHQELVACPQCGCGATRNFCAECGAPLRSAGRAIRAGKVVLAPLYEYFEHARAIVFPRKLVEEVRHARFGAPELFGFWLAAAALAALANAIFHQPSFTGVDLPILDEIADVLATMVLLVLVYSPLHPALNRGRRGMRYTEFLLVLLAIGALVYPWLMLMRGAVTLAGTPAAAQAVPLIGTLFFIRAFAALYGRSLLKVTLWLVGYFVAAQLILAALLAPLASVT
jgi:hypothetical protein